MTAQLKSSEVPMDDEALFHWIKVKCMQCSLHFMIATDSPEQHTNGSIHCPECGQHEGHFLVWAEPGKGFIFQHVPGQAQLIGCETPPN